MQLLLLTASLLALLGGPLAWHIAQRRQAARGRLAWALDMLVLASITALILLEVLPEAAADSRWLAVLPWFAFGLVLPPLLEHGFRRLAREMHLLTLAAGITGLALHAVVDGAVIDEHGRGLSYAVVLHRIPVGLALWWLIYPALGLRWAVGVLTILALATIIGFSAHHQIEAIRDLVSMPWLQSLIAGLILHVLYTRPHLEQHRHHGHPSPNEEAGDHRHVI